MPALPELRLFSELSRGKYMDKLNNSKNKNKNKNKRDEDWSGVDQDPLNSEEQVSDAGSHYSRSSKPGSRSSKAPKEGSRQEEFVAPSQTVKRKDISPLLGSGETVGPDKRRKCKSWRRLINTDQDSGSESDSEVEITPLGEATPERKESRAARVARRKEIAAACEQKEKEMKASRPVSPILSNLDLEALRNLGNDWLEKIDTARLRSGNLEGNSVGK